MKKTQYRILEFKDYFQVQGRTQNFFKYSKWKTISKKNKTIHQYVQFFKIDSDNFFLDTVFKTKEEALQFIEDMKKYPIIHETKI